MIENETHKQSLEEKHRHAREALEHYLQSVKDQRDQDQRRHEQQIQQLQAELRVAQQSVVVKQEEVTRLNQDGVRLVAELSHTQNALYDEQSNTRRPTQKLEALPAAEQRCHALAVQAAASETQVSELRKQYGESTQQIAVLTPQVHDLQIACAAAQAKSEAQQTITDQLHAYMANKDASLAAENRPA